MLGASAVIFRGRGGREEGRETDRQTDRDRDTERERWRKQDRQTERQTEVFIRNCCEESGKPTSFCLFGWLVVQLRLRQFAFLSIISE